MARATRRAKATTVDYTITHDPDTGGYQLVFSKGVVLTARPTAHRPRDGWLVLVGISVSNQAAARSQIALARQGSREWFRGRLPASLKAIVTDAALLALEAFVEKTERRLAAERTDAARIAAEAAKDAPPPELYVVDGGRLCRVKLTKDGEVLVPLANFAAHITDEFLLDDGQTITRAFQVAGTLESGKPLPSVRIPVERFGSMQWVPTSWGRGAIVSAGVTTRDYLREALQRLSPEAPVRRVYTHTGWRVIDDRWVYLTGSVAVGADGIEVDVDLGTGLEGYQLPLEVVNPREAMQQSLALLRVAPFRITAPLWGAVFRAPLCAVLPVDLTVWLEGDTGAMKSTLAALFLCHTGEFTRLALPGSWLSTANQLERLLFTLKDALAVIDDYAPQNVEQMREFESKAHRVLRAQGNLAGRGRLRPDLTLRPSFHPRGLCLVTGELHPPGLSGLARALIVKLENVDITMAVLDQVKDTTGRLAHGYAGYLGWLAPQMATLAPLLKDKFIQMRAKLLEGRSHLRIPEILAHLWLGIDAGLEYATEVGAIADGEATALAAEAWAALIEAGTAQDRLLQQERPSHRFLRVLFACLVQCRAVTLSLNAEVDEAPPGSFVGWQDAQALYLNWEATWHAVTQYARETGEAFAVRQGQLRDTLVKDGFTTCDPGRTTAVVWVGERSVRVVWLRRDVAERFLDATFPGPYIRPEASE